ncbi:uncharacterized protein F5147DRAFT_763305 [Suillus discolor]|uniref:Uncharacterized protein n=1 Tax=Suillus discolor TaxID=1912936 RepID=A0A9P7F059_9AGAM|nr:uncharacterized protein F5147DRAFT_763305 [Suillus discolor]KAG2097941.1 hypothetical protein F5147DRAFT_763305 [Suillus discolor]
MADQFTGNSTSRLFATGYSHFIIFRASISEVPRYLNATPRLSALCLPIHTTLSKVAANNGELETLRLSRRDVEQWLKEWNISVEECSQSLKSVVDAFRQFSQPEIAYHHTLSSISSLPSSSPESQSEAVDAIALALRLPSLFDFDPLFKLDAVVSAKDHEPFSLLQVFLNSGLPELHSWPLFSKNMILQIELSEVEKWAIDGIRTSLLSAKLSQTTQSLHVCRSSACMFKREQWEVSYHVEGGPSERAGGSH